jgi:hypothetical protein
VVNVIRIQHVKAKQLVLVMVIHHVEDIVIQIKNVLAILGGVDVMDIFQDAVNVRLMSLVINISNAMMVVVMDGHVRDLLKEVVEQYANRLEAVLGMVAHVIDIAIITAKIRNVHVIPECVLVIQ